MKIKKLQLRGNNCAREHCSFCAAAHPRSLEGTLIISEVSTKYLVRKMESGQKEPTTGFSVLYVLGLLSTP
jgi:hypothetical protein